MNGKNKKAPIVKVMSFNIAHGLGMYGVVDLEKTAQVIEDSCATIVALQEVDRHFSVAALSAPISWTLSRHSPTAP